MMTSREVKSLVSDFERAEAAARRRSERLKELTSAAKVRMQRTRAALPALAAALLAVTAAAWFATPKAPLQPVEEPQAMASPGSTAPPDLPIGVYDAH